MSRPTRGVGNIAVAGALSNRKGHQDQLEEFRYGIGAVTASAHAFHAGVTGGSNTTDPEGEGLRQEVDIRYVVTSLAGSARHVYERVYCKRGQMENLIKLHKAQLASDRTSCHSATANQVRLVLHTVAFWLMHAVRSAIPDTNPLAKAEFATIRERLFKIGARVIEHIARIRIHLPTSCPEQALFRHIALGLMPAGP